MSKQFAICIFIVFSHTLPNVFAQDDNVALLTRHHQSLSFESGKKAEVKPQVKGAFQDQKADESKQSTIKKAENDAKSQPVDISCEYVEAANAYRLVITESTGGGVVLNEQLLEQAPAEGYATSVEMSIPVASKAYDIKKYIYVKSKSSPKPEESQYSQVELEMTVGKARLIMDINAINNSTGSRKLKYDHNVQQQLAAKRLGEIEEAIKSKTATEEQMLEMRDLQVMEQAGTQNRWDFSGNRRREMKEKRSRHLEADGLVRQKRMSQEKTVAPK